MSYTNKTYYFSKDNISSFYIDSYKTNSEIQSLVLEDSSNLIKFNNLGSNKNTDNFYGRGKLGDYTENQDLNILKIPSLYCESVIDHPIYGWILNNCWFAENGDFQPGDEVVISKKHIKDDSYIDEIGKYEYLIIEEKIIESDTLFHYKIKKPPSYEFDNNSLNAVTKVLEYKNLFINDGKRFEQRFSYDTSIYYKNISIPVPFTEEWGEYRRCSPPSGLMIIKASESITLGSNSFIGSSNGYCGNICASDNDPIYSTPQGFIGGCTEDGEMDKYYDTRAPFPNLYNEANDDSTEYGIPNTAGGCLNNGIKHSDDSAYGNKFDYIDDLSYRINCGVGGQAWNNSSSGTYIYGFAGGGIVIIQTPKLIIGEGSTISAKPTYLSDDVLKYGARGSSGGGSILIKSQYIEIKKNPKCMDNINADNRPNIINGVFQTILKQEDSMYDSDWGTPGQIQIDFETLKLEETEYTVDDLPDSFADDVVVDNYYIARKEDELTLEESGTIDEWEKLVDYLDIIDVSPIYETDNWFKIYTKGSSNINLDLWYTIYNLLIESSNKEGEIRILISLDKGENWKYIENINSEDPIMSSSSLDDDIDNKSNTVEEINNFLNSNFLTQQLILSQKSEELRTIDFCFALKTSKSYETPSLKGLSVFYDKVNQLKPPIPIKPFNGSEFRDEWVNFVWLQPEQKYGSLGNRLLISETTDFRFFNESLNFSEDYESLDVDDNIILPFKPIKYSDSIIQASYFEPLRIVDKVASDTPYGTLSVEVGDEIIYNGGDEIYDKGSIATSLPCEKIKNKELESFIIEGNIPYDGDVLSYINFTNKDIGDILDSKEFFDVTFDNNVTKYNIDGFGTICDVSNITDAVILTPKDSNTNSNINIGYNRKAFTLYLRFYLSDSNTNYQKWFESFFYDSDGNENQIARNRISNPDFPKIFDLEWSGVLLDTRKRLNENSENVLIVVGYEDSDKISLYLNGVEVYSSEADDYRYSAFPTDDTETNSGIVVLKLGNECAGSLMEFCFWNESLDANTIYDISKTNNYHLRYDFRDPKLTWLNLKEVQGLEDNILWNKKFDGGRDAKYSHIDVKELGCIDNPIYYSNNNSILVGIKKFNNDDLKIVSSNEEINGLYNCLFSSNNINSVYIKHFKNNVMYVDDKIEQKVSIPSKHKIFENCLSSSFELLSNSKDWYFRLSWKRTKTTDMSLINDSSYRTLEAYLFWDVSEETLKLGVYAYSESASYTILSLSPLDIKLKEHNIYTFHIENDSNDRNNLKIFISSLSDLNLNGKILIADRNNMVLDSYKTSGTLTDLISDVDNFTDEDMEYYNMPSVIYYNNFHRLISIDVYKKDSLVESNVGYLESKRYKIELSESIKSLKNVELDVILDSSDLFFAFSFDGGESFLRYNFEKEEWENIDKYNIDDYMNVSEVLKINTYEFNRPNGFIQGNKVIVDIIAKTLDELQTPIIKTLKINYDGPLVIDSWDDAGTFYDPNVMFYYNDDGSWNPYIEPDFNSDSQNWKQMGTKKPDEMVFDDNGSKPTIASNKVFAGARVKLVPQGKYYWKVAAYNGN